MTHFSRFGLENFRTFSKYQEVEFAPITVFTGPNNAGKSTVLKAIQLLENSFSDFNFSNIDYLDFNGGDHNLGNFQSAVNSSSNSNSFNIMLPIYLGPIPDEMNLKLHYKIDKDDTYQRGRLAKLSITLKKKNKKIIEAINKRKKWYFDIDFKFLKEKLDPEVTLLKTEYNDEDRHNELFSSAELHKKHKKEYDILEEKRHKRWIEKQETPSSNFFNSEIVHNKITPIPLIRIEKIRGEDYIKSKIQEYLPEDFILDFFPFSKIRKKQSDSDDLLRYAERLKKLLLDVSHQTTFYDEIKDEENALIVVNKVFDKLKLNLFNKLNNDPNIKSLQEFLDKLKQAELLFIRKAMYSQNFRNYSEILPFLNEVLYGLNIAGDLQNQFYGMDSLESNNISKENKEDYLKHINSFEDDVISKYYHQKDDFKYFKSGIITHHYGKEFFFNCLIYSIIELSIDNSLKPLRSFNNININRNNSKRVYMHSDGEDLFHKNITDFAKGNFKDGSQEIKFINKWLKEFDIVDRMKIESAQHGIGSVVKLGDRVLSDYGYGLNQFVPILIKIALVARRSISHYDIPQAPGETGYYYFSSSLYIEEPESNLHPRLQSKLADMFVDATKEFNIQFIIETHSEYLIRKLQYLTAKKEIRPKDTSIYYFHPPDKIPDGEEQLKKLNIREDGMMDEDFGEGFFDESTRLTMDLLKIQNMN